MNEQESSHWWFRARRDIIRKTIQKLVRLPESANILEAGCGTGGNLLMLRELGELDAFEYDSSARHIAEEKSGMAIPAGELPDKLPHGAKKYDLIGLFDVLEHIENDRATLSKLGDRLADGGKIFVTVPALPWLWSQHDEHHHHYRRYTRASLQKTADEAGLRLQHSFYANFFLLPVAIGLRAMKKLLKSAAPDDTLPPSWLNRVLYRVFSTEQHFVGRIGMPVGLSVFAVLEKPELSR
ncbi:MAG: class I SAM-dependent methyltransferase [Paracoccaceae bacterium]